MPRRTQKPAEIDSTSASASEKPSEKSGAKKSSKKADLKKKAQALIDKYKSTQNRETGSLVGGEPDLYHYYHVGETSTSADTIQKLLDRGYEEETDKSVRFVGLVGGRIFRIPKEVKKFFMAERAKKFRKMKP